MTGIVLAGGMMEEAGAVPCVGNPACSVMLGGAKLFLLGIEVNVVEDQVQ